MVTLSVSALCCRYAGGPGLGPWTLRVSKGQRIGLAAPSGAGKTTLLDLIAGLVPSGLIIEPGGSVQRSGRIAYISQEPANSLSPFLTAIDQVAAFCAGRNAAAQAAQQLARLGLGTPRLQSAYPCQLSGGERQRVQVAQALAMQPDFILADEPTANLDGETAAAVLAALSESRAGLVIAAHRHDVFAQLGCDNIVHFSPPEHPGNWPQLPSPGALVADLKGLTHVHSRRDVWLRHHPTGFALRNLDFRIHAGELVALRGASGSGKTTLARCIARALGSRAQIVAQEPSGTLNPRQRLRAAFGEANPDAKPEDALRAMGLDSSLVTRRASELSEGQRARVAIARAIAALPSGGLLILDESLAGLDAATERAVLRAIAAEQQRSGLACLAISHQQDFPSHRQLELRDGRWAS